MSSAFNLIKFTLVRFIEIFFPKDLNSNVNKFPEIIGNTRFHKEIKLVHKVNDYRYAIYISSNNKQYFAKMWTGKFKNITYYWLKNEISNYKLLYKLLKHLKTNEIKKFKNIVIPKFKSEFQTSDCLILLIQYVKAKSIKSINQGQAINIYRQSLKYFEVLNNYLTKENLHHLPHIGRIYLFLSSPVLLVKAMLNYPLYANVMIRSWIKLILGLPSLRFQTSTWLVHKDLSENILLQRQKVYIIDYQVMSLSFKYLDVLNIEINHLEQEKFLSEFRKQVIYPYLITRRDVIAYRTLSAFSVLLHAGATRNLTGIQAKKYLEYINKYYV